MITGPIWKSTLHDFFGIFRSSITDEYCPPDQVDSIQEQTLEILQDLYLEINVTSDYQDMS